MLVVTLTATILNHAQKRAIGIAEFLHVLGFPRDRCWTAAARGKRWLADGANTRRRTGHEQRLI